jgi:hypothetical protein
MAGADPDEPVSVALDVAARLDALGVVYVIGGSLASSVHGEPRSTLDVDVVAALNQRMAKRFAKALKPSYYVDEDAASDAVSLAQSFNAVHLATAIKVDVFVAGDDEFEAERLRCRLRVRLGRGRGTELWVDTAEHTILRKLEWFRRGGEVSERQWRDVQAIIRIQGSRLDLKRLGHWAAHLGVTDLLDRVLPR